MNPDAIVDTFRNIVDKLTHSEWLSIVITIVVVVLITAIATKILTKVLRTLLNKGKGPLPSSTIFVNLLRGATWTIAVCIILSSCFNVNIGALVTALGVGGIAISLGFQSTLSSLFSGLQVSLTGMVKPGDHITVSNQSGTVRDVTWMSTTLTNSNGETVNIPNSVITSNAVVHNLPPNILKIPVYMTTILEKGGIGQLANDAENAVNYSLKERFELKKPAKIMFSSTDDNAIIGTLTVHLADSRDASNAKDVALRVLAPFVHSADVIEDTDDLQDVVKETQDFESEMAAKQREEQEKRAVEQKQRDEARRKADAEKHPLRHRLLAGRRKLKEKAEKKADSKK